MTLRSRVSMFFQPIDGWERLPSTMRHDDVAGVAVDQTDRVYLLTRKEPRVIVYERDGSFLRAFGDKLFTERTHGITIGPDGTVYCVDDGGQNIRVFTSDGTLRMTIGSGQPSDTGYDGVNHGSVKRGAGPFNRPTNLAVAPNGDLYVTDGYGNSRVHQFTADGTLVQSWGEPGSGPGEFRLPHGICVLADGRVLVGDRENDRIEVFDGHGAYLTSWTDVQRPTHMVVGPEGLIYVSELWWRPGHLSFTHGVISADLYGRVSILDTDGVVLARLGGGAPGTPGNFVAPHGIAVDSRGDLYVAEVTGTFRDLAGGPSGCAAFQKFRRG